MTVISMDNFRNRRDKREEERKKQQAEAAIDSLIYEFLNYSDSEDDHN